MNDVHANAELRLRGRGPAAAEPTPEELAAIMAAVEVCWPRPVTSPPAETQPARWRFSGRWWSKPLPHRRDRP